MFLVVVETDSDGMTPTSAEALTMASALATHDGTDVDAVVVSENPAAAPDLDDTLASYGVRRRLRIVHDLFDAYSPELWGAALAELVTSLRPLGLLSGGSDTAMEILAQAAARTGLGFAANCTSVAAGPEAWTLTRSRQGGLVLEEATLHGDTKIISLAQGAAEAAPAGLGTGDVIVEDFTPSVEGVRHSRLASRTTRSEGVGLANARVVVSGGRGIGSADGFAPLEELASRLGGAVGCSRVATNEGWRPHSDQVGQTGTKINPELYIACGISGATQHWVGCMGAKNILAINTDNEAPLVSRATYAVIGDAKEVIAAVNTEIAARHEGASPVAASTAAADTAIA